MKPACPTSSVVPYDPRWPHLFARLRERVDAALVSLSHETVHVGSTAVPGLAAKPIIDLDVVTRNVTGAVAALSAAGWQHQGDLGIDGQEAFRPLPGEPYHHLYVVTSDSQAYRDHVDLRDYLRTHAVAAARYAALKYQLAPLLTTDRDAYLDGKADLIRELLGLARQK